MLRALRLFNSKFTFAYTGRAQQCGRGLEDGKYFTYEMHNIIYTVALDYHGVFNGSDEYAMKVSGML